jgi:hypothetical protein
VPPGGIEPPTRGLGNRCSSPLSYEGEGRLCRRAGHNLVENLPSVRIWPLQPSGGGCGATRAGSDADGKARVIEHIQSIGMRPIDTGPLSSARILEAMGALNIYLNTQGGSWQNAWKLIEPVA